MSPGAEPTSMRVIAYGPEGCKEQEVPSAAEAFELRRRWPVVWLDVVGLGSEPALLEVGETFGIHRLALEDVTHVPQRPKVDVYGETFFLVCQMVSVDGEIRTEQLSVFVAEGLVVTFQERPGDCLGPVRERIRTGAGRIRAAGADYLAYALLDAVIDHQFPVLEEFGERLEGFEGEILEEPQADLLVRLRSAKRDLLALRRVAWPQRDALARLLRDDIPLVQPDTLPYLHDTYDHVSRILDAIETYRELAADLMNVQLTALSNQMNAVMKTLTMMATVFIPLTFLAGIYGMNFEHMPELKWPWAYPAVLAVMACTAFGMVMYFRRKRWL